MAQCRVRGQVSLGEIRSRRGEKCCRRQEVELADTSSELKAAFSQTEVELTVPVISRLTLLRQIRKLFLGANYAKLFIVIGKKS